MPARVGLSERARRCAASSPARARRLGVGGACISTAASSHVHACVCRGGAPGMLSTAAACAELRTPRLRAPGTASTQTQTGPQTSKSRKLTLPSPSPSTLAKAVTTAYSDRFGATCGVGKGWPPCANTHAHARTRGGGPTGGCTVEPSTRACRAAGQIVAHIL